jgi:hypothetical protein
MKEDSMKNYAELIEPSIKKLRLAIALNMGAKFDVTASTALAEVLQFMAKQLDEHAINRRERSESLAGLPADIDELRAEIEALKIVHGRSVLRQPTGWYRSVVRRFWYSAQEKPDAVPVDFPGRGACVGLAQIHITSCRGLPTPCPPRFNRTWAPNPQIPGSAFTARQGASDALTIARDIEEQLEKSSKATSVGGLFHFTRGARRPLNQSLLQDGNGLDQIVAACSQLPGKGRVFCARRVGDAGSLFFGRNIDVKDFDNSHKI